MIFKTNSCYQISKALSGFLEFPAELSKIFSRLRAIPANNVSCHIFAQKKSRNEVMEIQKPRTDLRSENNNCFRFNEKSECLKETL